MMSNELLFYGGIFLAAAALILLFAYAWISRILKKGLDEKLRSEYGEDE